ncbi:phosphatases II [Rickenella mellea]|uniref:phosphatidylinositol-3,4,5-trisphosphate 3-phosphatase n=1 Tax=Rickenella mellea TaxID=50990 RepID=A0A4Y7QAD5_9AGAM|nr:phosphatases II [Rickenella mellea]
MSDYIRRLVSGNKARFKDPQLNVELDLVYVTDHIIIMGFPAAGVEGFYRNRREDAKRFLEHRHGSNFWIFNFCPLRENSYPASFFNNRVSRYPFPDHHAPPLAILPLVAREIREWLSGSSEHVAVLHCKAGKGRSGTLACAYLLSLDDSPSPPKLQRNLSTKEWAKLRADQLMEVVETEDMSENVHADEDARLAGGKFKDIDAVEDFDIQSDTPAPQEGEGKSTPKIVLEKEPADTPRSVSPSANSQKSQDSRVSNATAKANKLEDVLALHTSRRMKAPSPAKNAQHGVSIPSQRRWLYYWSLILAHEAPYGFWASPRPTDAPKRTVRLREINVRMRDLGGMKTGLLRLANSVIERTSAAKSGGGKSQVWVSLARYDDDFVDILEKWEKHSRAEDGSMCKRRKGSTHLDEQALSDLFSDGRWDKQKMIRSFMRMGDTEGSVSKKNSDKDGVVLTYNLRPLSDQKWETIHDQIQKDAASQKNHDTLSPPRSTAPSASSSVTDLAQEILDEDDDGVILDAEREVRAKLYMGQVFMGWFWFIPIFHMPLPDATQKNAQAQTTIFTLPRGEIDFALGAGASIIDVAVTLEWQPLQAHGHPAPAVGNEPDGVVTGLTDAATGATVGEAVEAVEAAED